jgi:hypothetical protein
VIDLASVRVVLATLSAGLTHHQQDVIAYLIEENRTLRRQLAGRRLRLTDAQRSRLGISEFAKRSTDSQSCTWLGKIKRRRLSTERCSTKLPRGRLVRSPRHETG